ncbi:Uncharacterised protein [Kluyvera cryocrescens]|uniref:Uncharacterized protein n=1 Tax=Kluyvera cryocrescens TaxID=580 RepID=A0A485ADK6_KLUCR|nr:Uncharacterised protein [Kluyvera cryocrescens]
MMFFRQVIARSRFRAKQEHARYAVSLRVLTNFFIQRQNMQQVQVLTFVFVQAFDLNIKNGVSGDLDTGTRFDKFHQTLLVRQFDFAVLLAEFGIVSIFFQMDQLIEGRWPTLSSAIYRATPPAQGCTV